MTTRAGAISRGARRSVLAGALFLPAATAAAAAGAPRSAVVALGLYGFVLHTVFGKAYSLVPSYFDRQLRYPRAPALGVACTAPGALALAAPALEGRWLALELAAALVSTGAVLWALGAAVFLVAILATVRTNLSGRETGTAEAKAERRRIDRFANAFVPFVLAYLAWGAYETVAARTAAPGLLGPAAAAHLLATGVGVLAVLAIGARLLPRLLAVDTPEPLVRVALPAGAVGPLLLGVGLAGGIGWLGGRTTLVAGAAVESVAVLGYVGVVAGLAYRTDRTRSGIYGIVVGAAGGVVAVAVGTALALGASLDLSAVHPRIGVLWFLGATILGVAYHFYPPAIASSDWGDRLALASIGLVAGGVLVEVIGILLGGSWAVAGRWLAFLGGAIYAGLLIAIFEERRTR